MLLEMMVIGLCTGNFRCDKASEAYYVQSASLQKLVKESEIKAKDVAGPVMVNYIMPVIAPIVFIGTGHDASVRLNKNWALEVSEHSSKLELRWSW